MSTQAWRVLAELIHSGGRAEFERGWEALAARLSHQQLPEPFVGRLQAALAEAIGSIWAGEAMRRPTASLTIRVISTAAADAAPAQAGWGFFVVTRGQGGAGSSGLDIILYQDVSGEVGCV